MRYVLVLIAFAFQVRIIVELVANVSFVLFFLLLINEAEICISSFIEGRKDKVIYTFSPIIMKK
jgi:hypothetical protein